MTAGSNTPRAWDLPAWMLVRTRVIELELEAPALPAALPMPIPSAMSAPPGREIVVPVTDAKMSASPSPAAALAAALPDDVVPTFCRNCGHNSYMCEENKGKDTRNKQVVAWQQSGSTRMLPDLETSYWGLESGGRIRISTMLAGKRPLCPFTSPVHQPCNARAIM